MTTIYWIKSTDPPDHFPPVELACQQPNGLLAAGGDLSQERLLSAYGKGIFPWYEEGQEILWWSPNPRMVIIPSDIHISRSLLKAIKKIPLRISVNTQFQTVIKQCAAPRKYGLSTWITADMMKGYIKLHQTRHAHSIEVWHRNQLIGGIYGIAIGRVFFGESMFSRHPNGSKFALVALARWLEKWNFALIDCQVSSAHLTTMGGIGMPRKQFIEILSDQCDCATPDEVWKNRREIAVLP